MATGMDDFHELLREITKVAAWVMPTAGISPVIASLVNLNPPWPQKVGLTVATSAAVLMTLVAVYQFMNARNRSQVNKVITVGLGLGVLSTLVYFVLFAFLVYHTPVTGEAFVKGFECTIQAQSVFAQKCPWLDLDELKSAEYEAARLWTLPSIAASRLTLLFMWFAMFIMFSVSLGAFVRHQSTKSRKAGTVTQATKTANTEQNRP